MLGLPCWFLFRSTKCTRMYKVPPRFLFEYSLCTQLYWLSQRQIRQWNKCCPTCNRSIVLHIMPNRSVQLKSGPRRHRRLPWLRPRYLQYKSRSDKCQVKKHPFDCLFVVVVYSPLFSSCCSFIRVIVHVNLVHQVDTAVQKAQATGKKTFLNGFSNKTRHCYWSLFFFFSISQYVLLGLPPR